MGPSGGTPLPPRRQRPRRQARPWARTLPIRESVTCRRSEPPRTGPLESASISAVRVSAAQVRAERRPPPWRRIARHRPRAGSRASRGTWSVRSSGGQPGRIIANPKPRHGLGGATRRPGLGRRHPPGPAVCLPDPRGPGPWLPSPATARSPHPEHREALTTRRGSVWPGCWGRGPSAPSPRERRTRPLPPRDGGSRPSSRGPPGARWVERAR